MRTAKAIDSIIHVAYYLGMGGAWPPSKTAPLWERRNDNHPESDMVESFWLDVFAGIFDECVDKLKCYNESIPFGKFLGRGALGSKPPDIGIGDGAVEVKAGKLGQLNDSAFTALLHIDDPKIPKLLIQRGVWTDYGMMKMWYAFYHSPYGHILLDGSVVAPDASEYREDFDAIKNLISSAAAHAIYLDGLSDKPKEVCKFQNLCKTVGKFHTQDTNEVARFVGFGSPLQYLRLRPMYGIIKKEFQSHLEDMLSQIDGSRFVLLMNADDYASYDAERLYHVELLRSDGLLHMYDGKSPLTGIATKMIWIP